MCKKVKQNWSWETVHKESCNELALSDRDIPACYFPLCGSALLFSKCIRQLSSALDALARASPRRFVFPHSHLKGRVLAP